MYCREWALMQLKKILDLIYDGKEYQAVTTHAFHQFMNHYDYEHLNLSKEEIPKDRLMELIKFFKLSGVCEYDIFKNPDVLYEVFKENLPAEIYKKLKDNREKGNLVEQCEL